MSVKKVGFQPLIEMISFHIRRASLTIQSDLEHELEPLELRISEATLLIAIGQNPGCTQADLARDLHMKPANLVPIVRRLTREGFLKRVSGDGRGIALYLTGSGESKLAEVHGAVLRQEERVSRALHGTSKKAVLTALKKIARPLEDGYEL